MNDPTLPPTTACLLGLAILLLSLALPMPRHRPFPSPDISPPSLFTAVLQNLSSTTAQTAHHIRDILQKSTALLGRIILPGAETRLSITPRREPLGFWRGGWLCGPSPSANEVEVVEKEAPEALRTQRRRRRRLLRAVRFVPEVPRRTSSLGRVGAVGPGVEGGRV
ncbi:hypothetical protein B0T25DRAFT_633535 [Lasiosphaeria hispida]|uniref:Uncharacterized protein n=1 Tax=Lasiosphaeria hispida TaxID=260671 RepID=A0AAJ0HAW7_9PEZI|nr:hypothetical protein B0T25DRAFT_633535 [Lasiosphaeria hispida]